MKIKAITIKNFKAFDNITIDFTSNKNHSERDIELDFVALTKDSTKVIPYISAIMGRNSIGKSSLLDALVFFANFFKNRNKVRAENSFIDKNFFEYQKNINVWDRKDFREKILNDIENGKYSEKLRKIESNLYAKEYRQYARSDKKPIEISLELDHEASQNVKLCYPMIREELDYTPDLDFGDRIAIDEIKKLFTKLEDWAKNVILFKFVVSKDLIEDPIIFSHHLVINLAHHIESLMHKYKGKLKELNDLVKLANPNFIEFIKDEGALRYAEKGSSSPLSIKSLSTGTKRFLQLLFYIMKFSKNQAGILLIDEIGNFLHSELVNVIKIALMTIAKKYDLQVIFTTHNPLILNNFISYKQIILLDDGENGEIISSSASSKIKPRNNIIRKYLNGDIAMYPDPEYAKSTSWKVFKKW